MMGFRLSRREDKKTHTDKRSRCASSIDKSTRDASSPLSPQCLGKAPRHASSTPKRPTPSIPLPGGGEACKQFPGGGEYGARAVPGVCAHGGRRQKRSARKQRHAERIKEFAGRDACATDNVHGEDPEALRGRDRCAIRNRMDYEQTNGDNR